MKWPAPQGRHVEGIVRDLHRRVRDIALGEDYLQARLVKLEERVRFLEEHAQLAQFKREDTK